MKRRKPIDWIAVFAEDGVAVWNRGGGAVRTAPRPASGAPAAAWEAARGLVAAPRGSSGLVLGAEFFEQPVRLPARQAEGLPEAELRRALAYEAEPFSRIPPDAGLLAFAALPPAPDGSAAWDVVQVARADAEALRRAVRAAHWRLAGIGTPPRGFLASAPDADALASIADGRLPRPLVAPEGAGSSAAPGAVPLRQAALAAALVLCVATYVAQSARLASVRREAARRELSAQGVERLRGELQDVQRQCAEIVRAREEAAEAERRLGAYRGAWAALLRSLSSASAAGDAVVRDITAAGPFAAEVRGYGTDDAGPARAMESIAAEAGRAGWTVQPGELRASPGGVVRFAFRAALDPASAPAGEGAP